MDKAKIRESFDNSKCGKAFNKFFDIMVSSSGWYDPASGPALEEFLKHEDVNTILITAMYDMVQIVIRSRELKLSNYLEAKLSFLNVMAALGKTLDKANADIIEYEGNLNNG